MAVNISSNEEVKRELWDWLFLQMGVFPEPYPTHLALMSDNIYKEAIDLGYDLRRPDGTRIYISEFFLKKK